MIERKKWANLINGQTQIADGSIDELVLSEELQQKLVLIEKLEARVAELEKKQGKTVQLGTTEW